AETADAKGARAEKTGRPDSVRGRIPRSAARDGQAARSLRVAGRGAARSRRRQRAVPQVRGAREGSGEEAEVERPAGSRLPRGGEGRKGELYGACVEGCEGVAARDSGFGIR